MGGIPTIKNGWSIIAIPTLWITLIKGLWAIGPLDHGTIGHLSHHHGNLIMEKSHQPQLEKNAVNSTNEAFGTVLDD